jgi:hypothetical protein
MIPTPTGRRIASADLDARAWKASQFAATGDITHLFCDDSDAWRSWAVRDGETDIAGDGTDSGRSAAARHLAVLHRADEAADKVVCGAAGSPSRATQVGYTGDFRLLFQCPEVDPLQPFARNDKRTFSRDYFRVIGY